MMIVITTQYKENYGDSKNPYWKFKGGCDYKILKFTGSESEAKLLIDSIRDRIEYSNEFAAEYIINWSIKPEGYLTEFERDQLEFDGEIKFPATVL